MALALINTDGLTAFTALAIAVVPRSLEFKISLLYFFVQRLSPTPAPAK